MAQQLFKKAFRLDSQRTLQALQGEDGRNLDRIATSCHCQLQVRGNKILLQSFDREALDKAANTINQIRQFSKRNGAVSVDKVQDILGGVRGRKTRTVVAPISVQPKTPGQERYWKILQQCDVVFGVGPAGSGKSFLAVAAALKALEDGHVGKIVITRPVVEAGEKLGFLPGGLEDKLDPYLRPIYDAFEKFVGKERLDRMRKEGLVEIAPLAYLRGRTLSNAYIILDEAQNTTPQQIRMFLTRLGEGSRMCITGDRRQSDLPGLSGLNYALGKFQAVSAIAIVELTNSDVVRHPLVSVMLEAFGDEDEKPRALLPRELPLRRQEDVTVVARSVEVSPDNYDPSLLGPGF